MTPSVRRLRTAAAQRAPAPATDPTERIQFNRRGMVSWFQPVEAAKIAFRVLMSGLANSFVDTRELQGSFRRVRLPREVDRIEPPQEPAESPIDISFETVADEVWIDYVADVGDGWNPTYAVARLLGAGNLRLRGSDNRLPRGHVLVLGGDCVYPTPSLKEYRDRFLGPYHQALPDLAGLPHEPHHRPPTLLAIPGNHDWYDGLTGFIRTFCQGADIGVWRARQTRSYFAASLPGNWALWGTDMQLDNRIDKVQLDYFERAAAVHKGRRLILCTATPGWRNDRPSYQRVYKNYWFFEDLAIRNGCEPWVVLAGDLHHYSRYEDGMGRQLITAGGGGSYMTGTHDLPRSVTPPARTADFITGARGVYKYRPRGTEEYRESGFPYPSRTESLRLANRTFGFPFLAQNWAFCVLLGLLYAWMMWTQDPGRVWPAGSTLPEFWMRLLGIFFDRAMPWLPPAVLIIGAATFAAADDPAHRWARSLWGGLHGAAHVVMALGIGWALAQLPVLRETPARWLLGIVGVAGLAGGFLFGAYLVLSSRYFGWHENEVFAAQSLEDFRNFLRISVKADGRLTIYPVALRRVPRRWRKRLNRQPGQSTFEPNETPVEPELIEGPIEVRPPA